MLDAKQILPPLRRKDREITGDTAIENILDRCDVCRIALNGPEGYPYIVPLNFGWEKQDGAYVFYFHCAKAGTKLDLLRADGRCAFELDAGHKLLWAEDPAETGMAYESVCGLGRITEVLSPEEKLRGLRRLLYQYTGEEETPLKEHAVNGVTVLRMEVLELRAKKCPETGLA